MVALKKAPVEAPSPKPRQIALPHPLREDATTCILVKDADKPWLRALTVHGVAPGEKVAQAKLDGTRAAKMARRGAPLREDGGEDVADGEGLVQKVISLSKLRTSYNRFKARRELRDTYDLFLADERILPMLANVLGSTFFSQHTHTHTHAPRPSLSLVLFR